MATEAERPVYLNVHESDAVLEEHAETKVLDAPYWLISALTKLKEHHESFADEEMARSPLIHGDAPDDDLMEDFFHLIAEADLPAIDEDTKLLQVTHQHAQNALGSLTNSIRHKDSPERVMNFAVLLGAYARHAYNVAREMDPDAWSG